MSINYNLELETDVICNGSAAEICVAILELLLYQRNQIPFVYKIYRNYISKWVDEETKANGKAVISSLKGIELARQKELAKQTKDAIKAMQNVILESFKSNSVSCLRFLFGSTTFTAKEVYTIHIPEGVVSRNHSVIHHPLSTAQLSKTLITLMTSQDLNEIFSRNLCPTNLYLELEILEKCIDLKKSVFQKNNISQLPPSCKDIHFHLIHKRPANFMEEHLICCKELQIFEDFKDLNTSDDDDKEVAEKVEIPKCLSIWCEANIIVRGFKEKPIKGVCMWAN